MVQNFIQSLPKTELHLHIEGSLEPEMMFDLAKRNQVVLPYSSVQAIKKAYQFTDLQSFLDVYYAGMSVLLNEEDFYELTFAYLKKMAAENVCHVEIFFDPQGHTSRGLPFEVALNGIYHALAAGKKQLNISSKLIMCFLRHLSEDDAIKTYQQASKHLDKITGVGLDSSEKGNPPEKFKRVFAMARADGLKSVAHAGEEGPPSYIWDALKLLKVDRIDHGVRAIEDDALIDYLAEHQIPLTICPLSNLKICVYPDLSIHPYKKLLDQGVCVTINSDDPAYFGGYLVDNYTAIQAALSLTQADIIKSAENAIQATFLNSGEKAVLLDRLAGLS